MPKKPKKERNDYANAGGEIGIFINDVVYKKSERKNNNTRFFGKVRFDRYAARHQANCFIRYERKIII